MDVAEVILKLQELGVSFGIAWALGLRDSQLTLTRGVHFVMAGLWAAITGLELVWFLGLRRLIFESDSMVTVNLITRHNVKVDANYAPVVRAKEILVREWESNILSERLMLQLSGLTKNPFSRWGYILLILLDQYYLV